MFDFFVRRIEFTVSRRKNRQYEFGVDTNNFGGNGAARRIFQKIGGTLRFRRRNVDSGGGCRFAKFNLLADGGNLNVRF